MWSYLKYKVNVDQPTSLTDLIENMRHETAAIAESIFRTVIRNFTIRLNECLHLDFVHHYMYKGTTIHTTFEDCKIMQPEEVYSLNYFGYS